VENYDWVQGSGTWDDPYIIENITMNAGGSQSGIIIQNSASVYFIIRNGDITNAGTGFDQAGFKLVNTNNGKIINNDCSNNLGAGIYLYNSDNNTIEGNTADNNNDFSAQGSGINIDQGSNNNTVHNNRCFNNRRDGIILYRSSTFNNVTYNNCSENGRVGVMLLNYANNNTIAYNKLPQNGVDQPTKAGIHVESSYSCYILYNNVSNGKPSARGISTLQANFHQIVGNIANNNPGGGIRIAGTASGWTASHNYIADNIITYNTGTGLTLYASAADHCNDNTVVNNTVQHNTGYGISLSSASYNNLSFNTAKDNGNDGIYLSSSAHYNDIFYYEGSVDSIIDSGTGNNIQELVLQGPLLSNLVEITDPLEYGNEVSIRINATDSDGVNTTLIELSGVNYTMTNIVGDMWEYNWTPSSLGIKPYTIWANDSLNKWNSLSDSLTVQDTTAPTILNVSKNATVLEAGEILKVNVNATDLSGVDTVLFEILGTKYPMINIDVDEWEYNWTSYSNGTFSYTIWINDTLNNLNSNTSSIVIQDTVAPSLSNLYESADTLEVWDKLTVQINITDLGGVDTALFEIAGTNFTMYNIGGEKWEYNWTSDTLGLLPYTIWVNDSGGNSDYISDSVTVQDIISPSLSNLNESADPIELGDTFIVKINITDNYQIDKVLIEILSTNYTMTNIDGELWQYVWVPSSPGNFAYTIWVNDTTGNLNWIDDDVTVENVAVPSMIDLDESADPLELGNTETIQINITDLSGIDTVLFELQGINYSMSYIGNDIWEYIWNPSLTGFYPYTIWANDTLGNMNSTSDDITVQDSIAPNIFNLYENFDPIEIGQNWVVRINVTDVGGVNTTLIELAGTNHTMTEIEEDLYEFIWTPSGAGNYPYKIWANDSVGNLNFIAYSVDVEDTAIPNLSDLTEDSDPMELGNTFTVQINITDISGINTTLIEILGTNYTMTNIGGTIWEYSYVPSTVATISYIIWCNDTLGNSNSTSDAFTVQDSIGPTFNGLIEITDPLEFGDFFTIRINTTDYSEVNTTLFEISGTNYTMSKLSGDAWEFSWTPSATGILNYKIWANDTHNHWAYFSESIDVQDTIGPNLFNLFKSAEKVYLGNYITIRIRTTDLSGVDKLFIDILGVNYSMDLIAGELWEYNWKSSSIGTISFTIWANDTVGNWKSISYNFIVQSLPDTPTEDEPPDTIIIIVIIIIAIGATISVSGYAITTKIKKKSAQIPSKKIPLKTAAAKKRARLLQQTKTKTNQVKPVKAKLKKKGKSAEIAKPLTPKEKAELNKTEKEIGIAKQRFTCVVHRGSLHGQTIYLCKHCDTFYCERCAKVLKLKGDNCWTCGKDIDVIISEKDRQELLKKSALSIVEEIIAEQEFLQEFIESNKNLEEIPKIKEYLFSVLTPEEITQIDLLELSVEEKKIFIKELIALDHEERKSYLDEMLQK